ncbi:LPXTG cell wall anchor domain-containing protein [Kitasatospora sp. NPDC051914]|uniref:LPXTG cell wall anchor domain-containing protein n=1 Tax=Kitasatospora sp. NPDC051914 TaxID=3154945 RepID=UPI00342EED00
MRAPVISRFVRNAAVTAAAALTIGVGLPVLSGGTAVWAACGDGTAATAPQAVTLAPGAFLPPLPKSVTAGGAAVELGLLQANDTGKPHQALAPWFALFASEPLPGGRRLVNLQPEDVRVEVQFHGAWKRLPVRHSCDPTLVADTSSIAEPVPAGGTHRYRFRLTVLAKTPEQINKIDVSTGPRTAFRLAVKHPKPAAAPTTAKPTTAKPTPTKAAPVPAAATTALAATAAAPATELAETGPSTPTAFLLASGAAALALGGGVLFAARKLSRR